MKQKEYVWCMARTFIIECVLMYAFYRYYEHCSVERSITWALITAVAVLLVDILFYRFYLRPRLLRKEQEQKQKEQAHLTRE